MGFSYAIVKDIIVTLSIKHKLAYLKSSHLCPLQIFDLSNQIKCAKSYTREGFVCLSLSKGTTAIIFCDVCIVSTFFKKGVHFLTAFAKSINYQNYCLGTAFVYNLCLKTIHTYKHST